MSDNGLIDTAAEAQVLATVLHSPRLARVLETIPLAAFVSFAHRAIAQTMRDYSTAGVEFTTEMVMAQAPIVAGGGSRGESVRSSLIEMISLGNAASLDFFVERVTALHRARTVRETAVRLTQHVDHFDSAGEVDELDAAIRQAAILLEGETSVASGGQAPERLSGLMSERVEYDWLVPELLEVTDRMIVTGFEGTGKSYLLAQFAACLAAGIHPLLFTPLDAPKRVLVVDAENSRRQVTRRYRMFTERVDLKGYEQGLAPALWDETLGFLIRPEGLPLDQPTPLRLLENMIVTHRPDVVVAGPLYRLHSSDTKDEQAAKELIGLIDRLRVRYHFAFICEAHVNHGTPGAGRALRPTGSSVFLRWPEFGIGLRPAAGHEDEQHPSVVNVVHWRGGREERIWPRQLSHTYAMSWGPDDGYYRAHERRGLL